MLKSSIKPGQLDLGIICDCKDLEIAKSFAFGFGWRAEIRSFALRLLSHVDKHLTEETICRLTAVDEKSFELSRFVELPMDIRIHILEFTDLVAPADIEWNPPGPTRIQTSASPL